MNEHPAKNSGLVYRLRHDHSTVFQVARFLLVGGLSFVVDFGGLWLLHVPFGVPAGIASVVAFVASFFVNFFMQKLFTFKSQARTPRALVLYVALSVVNTIATGLFVGGLAPLIGWVEAKVISVIAISTWNYFVYKFVIFSAPHTNKMDAK